MKRGFKTEIKKQQEVIKPKVDLSVKRLYVIAFNAYAWFWLIREIFYRQSTNYEDYLLWTFTTLGMYFFVLDNNDIYFKIRKSIQK
ncbi:hypothetical protein [Pseudomonas shirazensis]